MIPRKHKENAEGFQMNTKQLRILTNLSNSVGEAKLSCPLKHDPIKVGLFQITCFI